MGCEAHLELDYCDFGTMSEESNVIPIELDKDGKPYYSESKGTLGGHSQVKIYGKLDCPSANRYIAKGQYIKHRVFFADEETAIATGYRPCAVCMKEKYLLWKSSKDEEVF